MTKFTARALPSCVPIGRTELFEEVTGRHSVHELQSVWIVPGHVFVTLNQGTKLLTFDCKPVTYQHHLGSNTLDFPVLQPSVVDILMLPSMPDVTFIVQENGHVHCWQFADTFQWSIVCEFDLCELRESQAKVISVCLHPKHKSFFWCEQRAVDGEEQHFVCQRSLPESIVKLKQKGVKKAHTVMEQCLASDVVSLGNGVLIVPRHHPDHARVCVYWRASVLEMASVTTIIGTTTRELHDMRSPLEFPSVLMNCLPDLAQMSPSAYGHGVKKDFATAQAVLLQSDGTVQIFYPSDGEQKAAVRTEVVKIALSEDVHKREGPGDVWCVHRSILAVTTNSESVSLYSLPSGQFLHEVSAAEGSGSIRGLARVMSPTVMVAFITDTCIFLVQGGKVHSTPGPQNGLPREKQFQTDALQVAFLSQEREQNPCKDVSEQLASLHSKWCDLQAHQPRSQLSDTVDTYLAEFWRLEEMANNLGKTQFIPTPPALDTRAMVHEAIARSHGMVSEAGAAELLWLSKKYPAELLDALLGDLDIEKEHMSADDQVKWQAKLGLGSGEGHTGVPANAMTFELICRLLYQEKPQSLVAFVRNAQHVSEQAVGVSAFVRKKHTLQYYVRAMECLPEPSLSKNPQQAATAKAQIILLGETEHGHELALRFLLQHGHWSEAIHLLQSLRSDSDQGTPLFFLLLQHLVQNQVLSDYASEMFALLPTWKSFLAAVKVISESPDAQYGQMAASSPTLFYSGSPDIPLSAIRPHLMSLLDKDSGPS